MLPPEVAQIERIGVENHRLGSVGNATTVLQPAVAQLAVFRRREAGVEAADGRERLRGQRKVVTGKELRLAGTRTVEMAVDDVENKLAGRCVGILDQRVYRVPANEVIRHVRKSFCKRR